MEKQNNSLIVWKLISGYSVGSQWFVQNGKPREKFHKIRIHGYCGFEHTRKPENGIGLVSGMGGAGLHHVLSAWGSAVMKAAWNLAHCWPSALVVAQMCRSLAPLAVQHEE